MKKERGIRPQFNLDSISHLFLTHTDMDHAGGVSVYSNVHLFDNAKLYLGRDEEQMIDGRTPRKWFLRGPVNTFDFSYAPHVRVCKGYGRVGIRNCASPHRKNLVSAMSQRVLDGAADSGHQVELL